MTKHILTLLLLIVSASSLSTNNIESEAHIFISNDTELSATLVLPKAQTPKAAVVFVHGSGRQTRNLALAERFVAQGIAAFVYDKRGVGESQVEYESKQSVSEQNLNLLAEDASAAIRVLQTHPKTKDLPIGLSGISQAGWIVPIAAENLHLQNHGVDFLILWCGPVTKVSEEDIYSKYTRDVDHSENRIIPYSEALSARKRPYVWPDFLGIDSNPSDNLQSLTIPALWISGLQDGSIPVDLSIQRLDDHIQQGKAFEYVVFSSQGHNNIEATFALTSDWVLRQKN